MQYEWGSDYFLFQMSDLMRGTLDLENFRQLPSGVSFRLNIDELDLLDAWAKNLVLNVNLTEEYGLYRLDSELYFDLESSCARCLNRVVQKINRNFHSILVDIRELEKFEDRIYNEEEEIYVYPIKGGAVDFLEIIYEQANFALPAIIACEDECEIPELKCGADDSTDDSNPFSILKNLKFDE